MTNKELIDRCNGFWDIKGRCGDCPYQMNICDVFQAKYHDTPYCEDYWHDGRYYTDEEIKE